VVKCFGDDVAEIQAADDEAELMNDGVAVPTEQDKAAGKKRTDDVKHWCHGSALP